MNIRKSFRFLLPLLLILTLLAPTAEAASSRKRTSTTRTVRATTKSTPATRPAPAPSQGVRITTSPVFAKELRLPVYRTLGPDRVSLNVRETDLAKLKAKGYPYERIPERIGAADKVEVLAQTTSRKFRRRVIPPTQVPYGLKMVYGAPGLDAKQAAGGAGVKIAVLSTGYDSHQDLARAKGGSVVTQAWDFTTTTRGNPRDTNGQGLAIIGTLASARGRDSLGLAGVAPDAMVLAYKVLDSQGKGYTDDIAAAIRHAADQKANLIVLPFSGPNSSPDELWAIQYAIGKGALVLAAAGNTGPNPLTLGYPAALPEVISVGAVNWKAAVIQNSSRGLFDGQTADLTAGELELVGPGERTLTLALSNRYATYSGTGMALAHVAGLAAKLWNGDAAALRGDLRARAAKYDITQAEGRLDAKPGYDIASGYGLPQMTRTWRNEWPR